LTFEAVDDPVAALVEAVAAGLEAVEVFSVLGVSDSPLGFEVDLATPVAPVEDFLESLI
jgi:hypothetical protein